MDTQTVRDNNRSPIGRWLIVGFLIAFIGCLIFYCLVVPKITGQACLDIVGANAPTKAIDRFLSLLFNATRSGDKVLLSRLAKPDVQEELLKLAPKMTENYQIVSYDDEYGEYDMKIRFDNGYQVFIAFWGTWHKCPDWDVTDEEIMENMKLELIEERPK
jgi:hypothetical protein